MLPTTFSSPVNTLINSSLDIGIISLHFSQKMRKKSHVLSFVLTEFCIYITALSPLKPSTTAPHTAVHFYSIR